MYHPNNLINFVGAIKGTDVLLIVLLIIFLLFSAFFSACETAFTSANSLRLRSFAEDKRRGSRRALYISENYEKALTTILVGNNLVNIASTTLCAFLFSKLIASPTLANILNTVIMTIIILIFGEITPKSLAKSHPEKTAMRYSGILYAIMIIFAPICWPFKKLQQLFKKQVKKEDDPTVTEDELESIIDTMEEEGVIESDNADMIQNVIKLSEATAYDIMTPRVDVICTSVSDTIDHVQKLFVDHQFSRLPIYQNTRDNIVGVINQKDLFAAMTNNKKITIESLMTEPVFVSETMKVDDLIREIQKTKKHLCVVLDEYGGTSGVVTMEDCIEEMVGEIYDEHDEEESPIDVVKFADNKYKINAELDIDELFSTLEIEHVPETNYSTVAGFLYELSEDLPKEGTVIKFTTVDEQIEDDGNFVKKTIQMQFTVTKLSDRRIREVELEITDIAEEDE